MPVLGIDQPCLLTLQEGEDYQLAFRVLSMMMNILHSLDRIHHLDKISPNMPVIFRSKTNFHQHFFGMIVSTFGN